MRIVPDVESVPGGYERPPEFSTITADMDVMVPMRDGVRIAVDVYRPGDAADPLPTLVAFAPYNKDIQGPEGANIPAQPAWSPLWTGPQEAGDTKFFVSRGYIHVIGMPRGFGKSESGGSREYDAYDLIEWIAAQPWCDGNVGMVGISAFGAEQFDAARKRPPHLKAIFPLDPRGAYGGLDPFRELYPGGVMHAFRLLVGAFGVGHQARTAPGDLTPELEEKWRAALENTDYRMHPPLVNILSMKGQLAPAMFHHLLEPFEREGILDDAERSQQLIDIPVYTGSGWYAQTYKTHLLGAQNYWRLLRDDVPKKLLFAGPAHLERPVKAYRGEMLRWYDHWLKGADTGILDEPPVRFWVMGANRWETAADWPLPETQWTPLYLNSWERLREEPFLSGSVDDDIPPDTFVQMPLTQTSTVSRLRYTTDPLSEDVLIAGPMSLTLYAAIDQPDTNWIVAVKDIGPDPGQQTAREGERTRAAALPEREVTRGWLKASHRALDPDRTTPERPFHRLTASAAQPVEPGGVVEYRIELMPSANMFARGHRIALDIMSADMPTGVGGSTNVEYIPWHITSSKTTVHSVFHDARHPSHLLMPVIPARDGAENA